MIEQINLWLANAEENSILQCTECKLIHAYKQRKSKRIDDLFNITVCPRCGCQAYRNTETKIVDHADQKV